MRFILTGIVLLAALAPWSVAAVEPTCSSDDTSGGVKVYENFFSQHDIETIYENQKSSPKTASWEHELYGSHYGASFLSKQHVNKLNQAFHGRTSDEHNARYILTKTISSSTMPHVDVELTEDGGLEGSEDVAFIFLNTNPKASFFFDGVKQEKVPVKAGSLVTFPGGKINHHTIVNSGVVQLAGPFATTYPHRPVGTGRNLEQCPDKWWDWIIYYFKLWFKDGEKCGAPEKRNLARRWLRDGFHEDVDVSDNREGVAMEE